MCAVGVRTDIALNKQIARVVDDEYVASPAVVSDKQVPAKAVCTYRNGADVARIVALNARLGKGQRPGEAALNADRPSKAGQSRECVGVAEASGRRRVDRAHRVDWTTRSDCAAVGKREDVYRGAVVRAQHLRAVPIQKQYGVVRCGNAVFDFGADVSNEERARTTAGLRKDSWTGTISERVNSAACR